MNEVKPLIFDTHAHYTSGAFNKNRHELLSSMPQQGVGGIIDCATDLASAEKSIELSSEYEYVYTAAGIHPQSLIEEDSSTLCRFKGDWRAEMKEMEYIFENKKVVAVGECGLDHHWPVPKDEQLLLFEEEIRFAMEHELPIIVHDREAHAETYALLKKYKPKAVLHSFSGSGEDVKWLCAQGVYISFTGVITFKNARNPVEACKMVPDEYLLLETDSPYLTPEPMRGKKNNSAMIKYTAQKIAEVRGVGFEQILHQTFTNAKEFFEIS